MNYSISEENYLKTILHLQDSDGTVTTTVLAEKLKTRPASVTDMMKKLDEQNAELINPIDTFAKTRKFAGDYVKGKRNLVSIRNGRTPNQALAFIHLEDETGECSGELKGEILFTSSSSAIYRQGGDPCVLQFTFAGSSVTLKEEQGCGNHRGLDCPMEGTYTKKKEPKLKTSGKKSKKK